MQSGAPHDKRVRLVHDEAAWPKAYIPPELVAEIPAALGDTLTMYKWLERGVSAHSAFAIYLGLWGKELGSHRGEPHYHGDHEAGRHPRP